MSKFTSRSHRCGDCIGCTAKACGHCVFCKDSTHFGGPGLKKQSCVRRRCARLLKAKMSKEVSGNRVKGGCGSCDECRAEDCGICLICMDQVFFDGKLLPGALCYKKKCRNSFALNLPHIEIPAEDDTADVPRGLPRVPKPKTPKQPKSLEWKPKKESKSKISSLKRKYEHTGKYSERRSIDSENLVKPKKSYYIKKKDRQPFAEELRETPSPSSPNDDNPPDNQSSNVTVERNFEKREASLANNRLSLFDTSRPINAVERAFLSITNSKAIHQSPAAVNNSLVESEPNGLNLELNVPETPPKQSPNSMDDLFSLFYSLPKAQIVLEKELLQPPCRDWPPPKVVYPVSIEPVLSQTVQNPNSADAQVQMYNAPLGYIISLDSDQLQDHFSDLASTIPIAASIKSSDGKGVQYKVVNSPIQQSPKQQRVFRISSPRGTYIAKRND